MTMRRIMKLEHVNLNITQRMFLDQQILGRIQYTHLHFFQIYVVQ